MFWLRLTNRKSSDLNDEFGVGVGEALKLHLVQIHNEELVCGCQLHRHFSELLIEVANITARFLSNGKRGKENVLKKRITCELAQR